MEDRRLHFLAGTPASPHTCGAAALDALVAAPEHHTLLFENAAVACWTPEFHRAGGRQFMRTVGTACCTSSRGAISFGRDAEGLTTLDSRSMPKLSKPTSTLWSHHCRRTPRKRRTDGASCHRPSVEAGVADPRGRHGRDKRERREAFSSPGALSRVYFAGFAQVIVLCMWIWIESYDEIDRLRNRVVDPEPFIRRGAARETLALRDLVNRRTGVRRR